jgi:hypothetical protein
VVLRFKMWSANLLMRFGNRKYLMGVEFRKREDFDRYSKSNMGYLKGKKIDDWLISPSSEFSV